MSKSRSNPIQPSKPTALASAVSRVLHPLVGLLLENGLTYTWLSGLLKSVFVDVAEKEFRLPNKRQTDSRITLLTGVHRKDVRRLRQSADHADVAAPDNVYLGAYLVAIWTSDKRFLDPDGQPKPLPRLPRKRGPSFEELVSSVSTDIRPRAVLDEWLRLGAVEVDDNDCVRLQTDAFIPSKGFEEKAYYMGRNVHDHIAAARHNVQGREPPFLERSVYYEELSGDSVRKLDELTRSEGMKLLQKLNRRARELQSRDKRRDDGKYRVNIGLYLFQAPQENDQDPEDQE